MTGRRIPDRFDQLPLLRADSAPPSRRYRAAGLPHRCGTDLNHQQPGRNRLTAALALAALALYPPAMMLPMLRLERLGQVSEAGLLEGVSALWRSGHWLIGAVILLFSVVLPPLKLIALWLLSQGRLITRHEHKAGLYRAVELVGRWGMLDVLLVAVLVAFVKLGDLVNIQPGRGLTAFAVMVLLSLLASLAFNPTLMWHGERQESDHGA